MSLQIRRRPEYRPASPPGPAAGPFLRSLRPVALPAYDTEPVLEGRAEPLPILATASDAREVVRFMRRRPRGLSVVEAANAEPKRIFGSRKLAAYEFWGILRRDGERLMLTELGREIAEALEPECSLYRRILRDIPTYRLAIEMIYQRGIDVATHRDVIGLWSEMRPRPFSNGNAQDMEAAVVCFFSLCHAAELGTATIGKRGQPARLRADIEQLAGFLAEAPVAAPLRVEAAQPRAAAESQPTRKVMVSSGDVDADIGPLRSLLSLAGFESRTAVLNTLETGLVTNAELLEIQQCHAGVFVIGPPDCTRRRDGTFSLKPDRITKISVSAALFEWRIIVFWNGGSTPPEELAASGISFVCAEVLSWESCLELVNRLKELAWPSLSPSVRWLHN